MRIENVGMTQNIPDKAQAGGLSQGDVLIAEVMSVEGDTVHLKSQDGLALTARLLTDIGVRVGDFVETVVDDAGGGRYVLRIVDITRGGTDAELSMQGGLGTARVSEATRALLGTMAMLKMNPGVDPKAAVFLSRHGLTGSAENLETLSQIVKGGETIGRLLVDVASSPGAVFAEVKEADSFQQTGTQMASANVAQPEMPGKPVVLQAETQQTLGPQAGVQSDTSVAVQAQMDDVAAASQIAKTNNMPVNAAVNQNVSVGTETVPEANKPVDAPSNLPSENMTAAQIVAGKTVDAASASNTGARQTIDALQSSAVPHTPSQPNVQTIPADSIKNGSAGPLQVDQAPDQIAQDDAFVPNDAFERITQRAVSLFVRLSDQENLAVHIKKAINELPEQLKELKLLMERTDTMNKGRLEPAEKQIMLLSQIKRFDCFHIPLMMQDSKTATAELYVYRYRNKKAAEDGENIVILLGLDTQYMGRVETLVKASGKSLGIELFLEDMRLAEEVLKDAAFLEQTAKRTGYLKVTVGIKKLAARTTVLSAEDRLASGVDGSPGSVDVRI